MDKILKKVFMGGYSKKSVHALLEALAEENEKDKAALTAEKGKLLDRTAELEKKLSSLEEEISSLSARLSDGEREREYVASAIVSAEKEAAKILSDAAVQAEKIKADTLTSLKEEREKVNGLRMSLYQAMQSYKDKLDTISATDGQ